MDTFLVERYWPGIDEVGLKPALSRLDQVAHAMRSEGQAIHHLRSILMPDDQVVFSLISAISPTLVRELNERADMPFDRIATAIDLPAIDSDKEV